MTEQITREQAKELVDGSEFGVLVVEIIEPIPAIGDVDTEDQQFQHTIKRYEFGDSDSNVEGNYQ